MSRERHQLLGMQDRREAIMTTVSKTPLLDRIKQPADLRKLSTEQLKALAAELISAKQIWRQRELAFESAYPQLARHVRRFLPKSHFAASTH